MYRLLNNLQGWTQNGYAGNHLMALSDGATVTSGVAGGIGGRTKSDKDIKRVKGKPHLKHGGKAKKRKY